METKDKIIYFESDDEFTDFCVAPYAEIKTEDGKNPYVGGNYSDVYKTAIEKGMSFCIKNEDSVVYKRQCVSKRVPVRLEGNPSYSRDTLVQLPVQNLKMYFNPPKSKAKRRVGVAINVDGGSSFTTIMMFPMIDDTCRQLINKKEINDKCINTIWDYIYEKDKNFPMIFPFAHSGSTIELIVSDLDTEDVLFSGEIDICPEYEIMSMKEAEEDFCNYGDKEEFENFSQYLKSTQRPSATSYQAIGINRAWDKLISNDIGGGEFLPEMMRQSLKAANASEALLFGESQVTSSTISFRIELDGDEQFNPDKLNFINFDEDYYNYSEVFRRLMACDMVSLNAIIYDHKLYFAEERDMDFGDNEGYIVSSIVNERLETK